MTASPGNSLFALSCTVSVVKVNPVEDGATKSHVQSEVSVSVATNGPF